ncbi:hypothetical protein, partial [Pyramidobacter porci]
MKNFEIMTPSPFLSGRCCRYGAAVPHALHPPAHDAVAGRQTFDDLGKPVRGLTDDDGTARDDPAVVDEP